MSDCLGDGHSPQKLKFSKVVPIVKKYVQTCNRNYWPISIVPTISKVYERTKSANYEIHSISKVCSIISMWLKNVYLLLMM